MKILHLIVSIIAILVTVYLVPGATVTVLGAVILAIVLGVINLLIKPVVKLIALPITILTLGIFSLVINALFIMLAAAIVPSFHIAGFWTAFWFSIVLSLVNAFFQMLLPKRE
jgi:putative membrane protein